MNKGLIAAVAVIAILGGAYYFTSVKKSAHESSSAASDNTSQTQPGAASTGATPGEESLKSEDQQVGNGAVAENGKEVTVHYTGTLTNGTVFDSSVQRNQPFKFKLGSGEVIPGWDRGIGGDPALGIQAMKVGGKRKLTIPPQLAYGDRPVGPIPPNSTLIFEVELLSVN